MRAAPTITTAIAIAAASAAAAQTPAPNQLRVRVVAEHVLDSATTGAPQVEPSLAIDPTDSRHMIVAAMAATEPPFAAAQNCMVFVTFDGGAQWTRSTLRAPMCGDPWAEMLNDGSPVVSVLTGMGRLAVFASRDRGRAWDSTSVTLGGGFDHPMMTVDRTHGGPRGRLYVVSSRARRIAGVLTHAIYAVHSDDGGRMFADSATHFLMNTNFNADRPMVAADGRLVVTFTDGMRNVDGFMTQRGRLERARTWIFLSSDGGLTHAPLMLASEMCGRGGGFPTAAIAPSDTAASPHIYVACPSRSRSEVLIARNTGAIDQWGDAIRVDPVRGDSLSRRTVQVAVNGAGTIGVVWFEQVSGRTPDCQRVVFTASADGGETFSVPTAVSSESFCVATAANAGSATRWPAGGEYIGFAAAPDGTFHVVWPDARTGVYRLRHAELRAEK